MSALTNRYEDDDASHLPPGMTRVGYDADTERYTFRQGDDLWLGEPGSLYGGKMKWAGKIPDDGSLDGRDPEDEDDEDDDDSDTSCSYLRKNGKNSKLLDVYTGALPYLQESGNEWGVPVTSISSTDAKPPDMHMRMYVQRRGTLLKKAAASTVSAVGVARRWSTKKATSGRRPREKYSVEQKGEDDKKVDIETISGSASEKD